LKKFTGYKREGSVFVEIIVVVAIISLLATLNVPAAPSGNRHIAIFVQIKEIENALYLYNWHNGFYPTTEQGLEALVTKPTTDPKPENYAEGGYMRKIPVDPWGNPYIYRNHGEEGQIDIISCGPDGIEGTEDDITNHNKDTIRFP